MSWHYSQALVEEFSALTCLDGDQCARLKSNRTAEKSCFEGKKKKFYRRFLSGMTYEHLMASLGVASWMSLLEDSPAKTYPLPEAAQESKENARDCGKNSNGSLAKYDQGSSSWKTRQLSLFGGSVEFLETWPRWGSMRNGECWAQPTHAGIAERRRSITTDSGFGSSQKIVTPHGMNNSQGQGGGEFDKVVRKMPTPNCTGYDRAAESKNKKAIQLVQKSPTPKCSDAKGAKRSRIPGTPEYRSNLCEFAENNRDAPTGGKLNPTWVEWLMGWPLGWTDLKPLETDRLLQRLSSHGKSLEVTTA